MNSVTQTNVLDDDRITAFGLLVEANRRLARTFEISIRRDHGLALVDFEALLRLGRSPERQMSMSELANQMVLTSGGVTRLIDRLVADEVVERVSCPSDRRVQWARLTDKGQERVSSALVTHLRDLDEHFFSAMSAEEQATMVSVLGRLGSMGEPG
jgi:MarR family 2-MHQ and catechol resistance regulon transcriptional repressor